MIDKNHINKGVTMVLLVSSRDELLDTVVLVVGNSIPARRVSDAERLWCNSTSVEDQWIGVIIDFRDQEVQRCALVDRIVRGRRVPAIIALVEPVRGDLIFELAQRGVHGWLPAPPDYTSLKRVLQRVVAETLVTAEIATIGLPGADDNGNCLDRTTVEQAMLPLAGPSVAARRLRRATYRAAAGRMPVVLAGESGSGKQVVAGVIHALSSRRRNRFVDVNICGIAETIFESELFGAVPGAFTGAVRRRGYFSVAHRGTLFLDEIGELPMSLQPKILKAVENGSFYPLGSDEPEQVDVRLICATNKNLRRSVMMGSFRADLWNRIASVIITVPPLRERLEDIPWLVMNLLRAGTYDGVILKPDAIRALQHHQWQGNVRELRSVLDRSILVCNRKELRARDLLFTPCIEDHPEPGY